jgi:hypothetical protein
MPTGANVIETFHNGTPQSDDGGNFDRYQLGRYEDGEMFVVIERMSHAALISGDPAPVPGGRKCLSLDEFRKSNVYSNAAKETLRRSWECPQGPKGEKRHTDVEYPCFEAIRRPAPRGFVHLGWRATAVALAVSA